MNMLMVLLVLNLGTVLADCIKEEEQNNISYILRFTMNMLMVLLVLNLGTVLADCSKEEEQNNWNTIQWFIRNTI